MVKFCPLQVLESQHSIVMLLILPASIFMRHKAHTVNSSGVQYLLSLAVCRAGAGKYHTKMLRDGLQAGVRYISFASEFRDLMTIYKG